MGQAGVAGSPMEGWAQGDAQRNLADRLAANTSGIMMGQYGQERGYQNQAQMGMPGAVGTAYGTAGQAAGQGAQNWQQSLNSADRGRGQAGSQYNQGINTALGAGQGLGGQVSGMINPYLQMYGLGSSSSRPSRRWPTRSGRPSTSTCQPAGPRGHDQPRRRGPGDAELPVAARSRASATCSRSAAWPAAWPGRTSGPRRTSSPRAWARGSIGGGTSDEGFGHAAPPGPMAQDSCKSRAECRDYS
jgi:hypothetical protein